MRKPLFPLALLACLGLACNSSKLAPGSTAIDVQPPSLFFNAVQPGQTSTKVVTVTNKGEGVLTVDHLALGGLNPTVFHYDASAAGPFPVHLGSQDWFAVQVTFSPVTVSTGLTATLSVYSDDPGSPRVDVPLKTPSLAPTIDAQPNPMDFGLSPMNQANTQPLTISNLGLSPLNVTGATLAAGSSPAFTVNTGTLPATIPGGGSITLPVSFTPTVTTAVTGTLNLASNDPANPIYAVTLTGSGTNQPVPKILAVPNPLDFGNVQRGTCKTLTDQIENVGNANLNVTGMSLVQLLPPFQGPAFTFSPTAFTVAPGGAQTLTVTFCPPYSDTYVGSINIQSNDPTHPASNPYGLGVTGNGVPPPISQTDIALVLTWDTNGTDEDTHFWRGGASYDQVPGDVDYDNMTPDWCAAGVSTDNPYLEYDVVNGYGPEHLTMQNACSDTYTVAVYYYDDHSADGGVSGTTNATIQVYIGGQLAYQGTKPTVMADLWTVGTVTWNQATHSGTWTLINSLQSNQPR